MESNHRRAGFAPAALPTELPYPFYIRWNLSESNRVPMLFRHMREPSTPKFHIISGGARVESNPIALASVLQTPDSPSRHSHTITLKLLKQYQFGGFSRDRTESSSFSD